MINCQFESGSKVNLRHVTVDGIIIKDGKVLLSKRGSYNGKPILESGKWSLIGGFVDLNETVVQAFEREAMEETGCKITNIKLLQVIDKPGRRNEDRQNISFVFIADFESMIDVSTEEVVELKWFPLDELPSIEEMAFDHGESLQSYKQFLEDKNSIKMEERFPGIIL